jgi:hypothetical protein
MTSRIMLRGAILSALALAALLSWPGDAQAWWHRYGWRGGFVVGVVPPPIVIGPPAYYYPPPAAYYPPPVPAQGTACYAIGITCPLQQPGPPGAPCSCPMNRARVGGTIG